MFKSLKQTLILLDFLTQNSNMYNGILFDISWIPFFLKIFLNYQLLSLNLTLNRYDDWLFFHSYILVQMVHCTADLRAAVVFDHETTPSLSAELIAVDRQGSSATVQFNLTIQDTNDPPIVRALSM